ncbi:IS3 family transposase [Spiroplasma endosymbiont of Zeiraphera isertana]|uniref:IS3 family transposase n=1 Tax=Spiroplasma endosymbiont of Zeiraphera isertana TaxID=3066313 RepID=UPI003CC7A0AD
MIFFISSRVFLKIKIYFYNNHRPQIKLKGMSPIEYRLAHSKPTNNYFIPINLILTNAIL